MRQRYENLEKKSTIHPRVETALLTKVAKQFFCIVKPLSGAANPSPGRQ